MFLTIENALDEQGKTEKLAIQPDNIADVRYDPSWNPGDGSETGRLAINYTEGFVRFLYGENAASFWSALPKLPIPTTEQQQ